MAHCSILCWVLYNLKTCHANSKADSIVANSYLIIHYIHYEVSIICYIVKDRLKGMLMTELYDKHDDLSLHIVNLMVHLIQVPSF